MKQKLKLRILYCCIVTIISMPLMFMVFYNIKYNDMKLAGVSNNSQLQELNFSNWINQDFQTSASKYFNENIAFRPIIIRFFNQVEFTFFRKINNNNLVLGKENNLFQRWHIDSYFGKDFIGQKEIRWRIKQLISIDSVLKLYNTKLIIALASDKASIFPEYFPEYLKQEPNNTNYKVYSHLLGSTKLNVIDFNHWFKTLKKEDNYMLFPKGGGHWSLLASSLVGDSIIKYCEQLDSTKLNKYSIAKINQSNSADGSDDDLVKISNLLYESNFGPYYYPTLDVQKEYEKNKSFIAVSDSYFWPVRSKEFKNAFKTVDYWFYFLKEIKDNEPERSLKYNSYLNRVKNADYLMLMASPSTLNKFGWNFIDRIYYSLALNNIYPNYIKDIINKIKSSPEQLEQTKEKAIKKNVTVDSMLFIDAKYIYLQKLKK